MRPLGSSRRSRSNTATYLESGECRQEVESDLVLAIKGRMLSHRAERASGVLAGHGLLA